MRTRELLATRSGSKAISDQCRQHAHPCSTCPVNAVFLPELNRRVSLSPWFAAERTAGKGLPSPAFDAPAMILPPCESLDFSHDEVRSQPWTLSAQRSPQPFW